MFWVSGDLYHPSMERREDRARTAGALAVRRAARGALENQVVETSSAPDLTVLAAPGAFLGRRAQAWRQKLVNLTLVLADVLLATLVWEVAFVLQSVWGRGQASGATVATVIPGIVAWVGIRALMGLYPGYGLDLVEELRRQTYAVLATMAIIATFTTVVQVGFLLSRMVLVLGFLGLLVFAPFARQWAKHALRKAGMWGKPVIVMGSGEHGVQLARLLKTEWGLGYCPIALIGGCLGARNVVETPGRKELEEAIEITARYGVDSITIAMPHTRREQVARLVDWSSLTFRHVIVIPNLDGVTNSAAIGRNFAGIFAVEIRHNLLIPSVRRAKRALDLVATVCGGLLVLPLIALLALLVWAESGGPVFYKAQRMGRDGNLFSCVKFRTMVRDAEAVLQKMLDENAAAREEYARYHKLREDPRVTRVGRFLRRTSLDELPQLWNVLRGEMSLVGPRPYLPRESKDIGATQSEILRVYPGITGPWQVSGRNHTSFEERVAIDARYVRNWSVWLDVVILARTVRTLLMDRGAY